MVLASKGDGVYHAGPRDTSPVVFKCNKSGVRESRLWCHRGTLMVLDINGFDVRE
jgi:hypothetical protein